MKLTTEMHILAQSFIWKCKTIFVGNRLRMPFLQQIDINTRIKIQENGSISIGALCETRNGVSFISGEAGAIMIGDGCFFNTGCSITALNEIIIGNNASFGNNVVIVDHNHNYKRIGEGSFLCKKVMIGNNVWVGANTVILPGTIIGDNAVIGAGSVVFGEIEPNTLFVQKRSATCIPILRNDENGEIDEN